MSKESRITALAIMKSMIESGHYRVPDDEFDSTLRGFVSLHERIAGPSEENQGGYRAVSPPAEKVGGTSDLPPLPATWRERSGLLPGTKMLAHSAPADPVIE